MAFRGGNTRMVKEWTGIPASSAPFTANSTFAGGEVTFNAAATVIRMIGEYIISPTGNVTALEEARVAVGIAVVSADAVDLGATALPDPGAEPQYPWLYWADHVIRINATASPFVNFGDGPANVRKSFDIRSMRKLKPRESLTVVAEYTDIVGTPGLTLSLGFTRVLVAIH